jgi:hypothetical protein
MADGLGTRRLRHRPGLGLVLVALVYLVAQLTLFSLERAPSWDEAVYLSQVTPETTATVFAPSRARGIVALVAPLALTGLPLAAVRAGLAVLSAAGLALAFGTWGARLKAAAPLAAAIFAFSWLGLFYGSEAMPNLWTALLGVAASGLLVSALDGTPRAHLGAGAAMAGMAFMRPPDAFVLLVALLAWTAFRRAPLRLSVSLVAGAALGAAPWLIEVLVRFGDPIEALRAAGRLAHLDPTPALDRVLQHLSLADGPTAGSGSGPAPVSVAVLVSGAALVVGTACAALLGVRRKEPAPVVAATAGWALVLVYPAFVDGLAPRFLMPGLALLAIAAAWAWSGRPRLSRGRLARVGAAAIAIAWLSWQVALAVRIESTVERQREPFRDLGASMHEAAAGEPCSFRSEDGFPQIQLSSGCSGGELTGRQPPPGVQFLVVRDPEAELPASWLPIASARSGSGQPWVLATRAAATST